MRFPPPPKVFPKDENFHEFIKDSNHENILFSFITNGGTLSEFCRDNAIPFSLLFNYIGKTEDLRAQHDVARGARREAFEESILMELRELISFNIADLYDSEGKVKKITEIPLSLQKAIKSIDFDKNKIVFVDRLKALEVLARTTSLLTVKVEHSADEKLEDLIGKSFKVSEPTPPPPGFSAATTLDKPTFTSPKNDNLDAVDNSQTVTDESQGITGDEKDVVPEIWDHEPTVDEMGEKVKIFAKNNLNIAPSVDNSNTLPESNSGEEEPTASTELNAVIDLEADGGELI